MHLKSNVGSLLHHKLVYKLIPSCNFVFIQLEIIHLWAEDFFHCRDLALVVLDFQSQLFHVEYSGDVGGDGSWKSMEMEIESLLEKLVDVNDAMSRCVAGATSTTSVTQKLARHRDILHEFTQVCIWTLQYVKWLVTLFSLSREIICWCRCQGWHTFGPYTCVSICVYILAMSIEMKHITRFSSKVTITR